LAFLRADVASEEQRRRRRKREKVRKRRRKEKEEKTDGNVLLDSRCHEDQMAPSLRQRTRRAIERDLPPAESLKADNAASWEGNVNTRV
jgi:hypothetical protein